MRKKRRSSGRRRRGNKAIHRAKEDIKSLGRSGFGLIPGVGEILGWHAMARDIGKVSKSGPRALKSIGRGIRRRFPKL